jgi:hypothetical protein
LTNEGTSRHSTRRGLEDIPKTGGPIRIYLVLLTADAVRPPATNGESMEQVRRRVVQFIIEEETLKLLLWGDDDDDDA